MTNPLLARSKLPPFAEIKPEHIQPAVEKIIRESEDQIENMLSTQTEHSWASLQLPLDEANDRLSQVWSSIQHMNAVINNDELRATYNACLPLLSEHSSQMGQNSALHKAYQQLSMSDEFSNYDDAQKKVINNQLRDFQLAGIALADDKKIQFKDILKQLSTLSSQFSDNVLDATMAWSKLITNGTQLKGLPESALTAAKQQAKAKGHKDGWLLTLDYPSYFPVITYCDNQQLRKEIYTAYTTRSSDQGPNAGQNNNSDIINSILDLRHQLAKLLDFDNYADYSLVTKMAENSGLVIKFLEDLTEKSKPQAEKEYAALKAYAKDEHGIDNLDTWDISYYSEKLRQARYSISQEELRPWFPAEKTITGLFEITKRLFGVQCEKSSNVDVWHPDVNFYNIIRDDTIIGHFYLDLYARKHKRGGAWMDECRVRRKVDNTIQLPVAYLTCNFTPPQEGNPALLTHDEVVTLFHEFGHGLHHMLTKVDYAAVSGINGVAWDAVELPSQFMENWCWEQKSLELISGHYLTNEPLPTAKLEQLLAARNFQSAMVMLRQLELSLFDFRLHREYQKGFNVQDLLNEVRKQVAVISTPAFNRFQNSFTHIFSGGYAAGYYSYKWAEVLSADAFSRFEKEGLFNHETGRAFLKEILEKGGSADPMELFVNFMKRKPTIDALLQHSGIYQQDFKLLPNNKRVKSREPSK